MKKISALILVIIGLGLLAPLMAFAQNMTYQKPTRDDQPPNGGSMITLMPEAGIGIIPNPDYADTNLFLLYRNLIVTYDTTTTARRILNGETGATFVITTASSNDVTNFTLPPAKAGLNFTFYDRDTTSGGNLAITTQSGDTIDNNATVYRSNSTVTSTSLRLVAVDTTHWHVDTRLGTWLTITP